MSSNGDNHEKNGNEENKGITLGGSGFYDQDIYGGTKAKFAGYDTTIDPEQVFRC